MSADTPSSAFALPGKWRTSFKTKVILPVIIIIAVQAGIMMALFSSRLSRQIEDEAGDRLRTAQAIFRELQRIRSQNVLLQYKSLAMDPRFKAVAQLGDARTMRFQLEELLGTIGADGVFFVASTGVTLTGASRVPTLEWAALADRSAVSIRKALSNEPSFCRIQVQSILYELTCLPVEITGEVVGALAVATRIEGATMQEFKRLTHAEVALVAGNRVLVSSLTGEGSHDALIRDLQTQRETHSNGTPTTRVAVLEGEHFRFLTEPFLIANTEDEAQCLLLCSYEQSLGSLRSIQKLFWLSLVAGLATSSVLVYAVVGRMTEPLRLLRTGALEVGQGDFTRRVAVTTADECGELAGAFNQMTEKLQESRASLEAKQRDLALAYDRAQEGSKAKSEFFATISHELRTPLNGILGMTSLLLETPLDQEQADFAQTIRESGEHLMGIVTDILDFSRIDTGREVLQIADLNISCLAAEVTACLSAGAEGKGLTLTCIAAQTLPAPLRGDNLRIRQVLFKLIGNAIKFTQAGQVCVQVRLEEETATHATVVLEIADTGIGIPEEVQPRLFQPFCQADASASRRYDGTGLGLAISKRLVEMMGGEIGLTSAPGKGSTFRVRLRLLKCPSTQTTIGPGSAPRLAA